MGMSRVHLSLFLWLAMSSFAAEADSKVLEFALSQLRPAQVVISKTEVAQKTDKLLKLFVEDRKKHTHTLEDYLNEKIPVVVIGPEMGGSDSESQIAGERAPTVWVVDGNHLVSSLLEASDKTHEVEFQNVKCEVIADWHTLSPFEFQARMIQNGYVWLFDERSEPIRFDQLPVLFKDQRNDHYRDRIKQLIKDGVLTKTFKYFFEWIVAKEARQVFPKVAETEPYHHFKKRVEAFLKTEAGKKFPGNPRSDAIACYETYQSL